MKESSSESVLQKPIEKLNLFQLAFGDGTTKKALFSALVVGSILTSINHGDMILSGEYPSLAESHTNLFCTILCHNLGGHYR